MTLPSKTEQTEEIALLFRHRCLVATDWIETHPGLLPGRSLWLDYRQQLQDLPLNPNWPLAIPWPEPPRSATLCARNL